MNVFVLVKRKNTSFDWTSVFCISIFVGTSLVPGVLGVPGVPGLLYRNMVAYLICVDPPP